MDERMRFVIRLKDGETMASLCREFGISGKTGYKIFERYEQCGLEGLSDRARRPFRYANQLPEQVEAAIVSAKREKPHWGARKIRERLLRRLPHAIKTPAASTVHAVLDRHGLVQSMGRRRSRAEGAPLSDGLHPNDLWCTDYKGEFQLSDKRYCYPLTVTDYSSRFLLLCEALESNRQELAFPAFERLFHERGLPRAIRSDNGVPFASPHGLFQLSRLSVWWLRLGISMERIRPGHPQQNGRHERMHLTLKKEATRPAGANLLQQQAKFDTFLEEFNHERPHEALAMKCPAEIYSASSRPYRGVPEPHYPFHDRTVVVTSCGRLCLYNKKINLSVSLAGQAVGVKEVDDGRATEPIRTTFRSPWQNGVAERWVGSCRRDLLDHVIVLNERHLKRLMREYIRYYHEDRTHLGLAKDTPDGRLVARDSVRERRIQSFARLGGLHHRYAVAAWQAILRTGKLWHGSRLLALLPNRYYLSLLRIGLSAHYLSNFEMRRGKAAKRALFIFLCTEGFDEAQLYSCPTEAGLRTSSLMGAREDLERLQSPAMAVLFWGSCLNWRQEENHSRLASFTGSMT